MTRRQPKLCKEQKKKYYWNTGAEQLTKELIENYIKNEKSRNFLFNQSPPFSTLRNTLILKTLKQSIHNKFFINFMGELF